MFPASIRWRLQIWLGVLLVGLLTAFGTTAWQLEKTQRLRRLDDDLEKQVALLGAAVRGPQFGRGPGGPGNRPNWPVMGNGGRRSSGPGGPGGPDDRSFGGGLDPRNRDPGDPSFRDDRRFSKGSKQNNDQDFDEDAVLADWFMMGDRKPGPPEFREEFLPSSARTLFNASSPEGFYYVVWLGWSQTVKSSALAPASVPMPSQADKTTQARFRDREGVREAYYFTERGECVLAGRPVTRDLATMRPVAIRLTATGLAILVLGLGGGWLLTSRSIRPIEQIASAAQRISEKNLSERIPPTAPGSELGALADVLNTTFSRLEDSFYQQKRFTSDASHELRTPLTVLISETQTALSRERTPEEYREVLEGNLDTARRMKRLAEALLELARLDTGSDAESLVFDMALIARDRADRLRSLAAERSIQLSLELRPALVQSSPDRFALVVTNLVENAISYGRQGGTVTISTLVENGLAILEITDDGIGISAEDLPHIFERFYRADKSRSHSGGRYGLGLAICQGMITADGGSISAVSNLGEGSTFRVTFPAMTDGAQEEVSV